MGQVTDWLWLIIVGGYFFISTFFLCFPNILHKRKHFAYNVFNRIIQSRKILCVGHRGAAYQAPENTLQGFEQAKDYCDIFEMDICGTKDGQLVINHDVNFQRTTGVNKDIRDLNFHELPTLKEQYIPYCADFLLKSTKNKMPLLEDLFKIYPKMPMMIELKTPFMKITGEHQTQEWPIVQLNRLIKKYQREDITIWGSQLDKDNSRMNEINPYLSNWYSEPEIIKLIVCFLLGLLPFICLRPGFVLFPLVSNVLRKELQSSSKCMRCLRMVFYYFFNFILRFFSSHLTKRGIIPIFFTVNEDSQFQAAVSIGCLGIITDRPSKLKGYLKSIDLVVGNEAQQSNTQIVK